MKSDGAAVEPAAPVPFAVSEPFQGKGIDASLLAMTGLEQVRTHIRGDGQLAPISVLLGMRPIEADEGLAVFAMPASGWLLGSDGRPQAGVLAPLADAAHSAAVATTFGTGSALATVCLTLSYLAPLDTGADELVCTARVDRREGDDVPVQSIAEVVDDRGSLLARSTARCAVYPIPGVDRDVGPGDRTGMPPPRGSAAEPAPGSHVTGDPPIQHLTGLRAAGTGQDEVRFTLPATTWISSILHQVQGGALAMLAEAALDGAVLATLDSGGERATVEVRLDFLRKVPAGDELLEAAASLVHRGRNFAFGAGTVSSAGRGPVAVATSVHRLA